VWRFMTGIYRDASIVLLGGQPQQTSSHSGLSLTAGERGF
jgi:hypothetical protein